jgi:hypothetical protein
MKKFKFHKTFIGALAIWVANVMCGPFKTYFAAIMMFLIFIAFSSCGVKHYSESRTKKKADKMVTSARQQYAFVNNQIIIFENGY